MFIIDGEELSLQCKQCGTNYKHIIGYGPCAPNELMRRESLRKNPPHCPKCGSSNYKQISLLDTIRRTILKTK